MRFFRRKRSDDDETERCPRCSEPVPEGAAECMMCGLPLEPFRAALSSEEAETQTADRLTDERCRLALHWCVDFALPPDPTQTLLACR